MVVEAGHLVHLLVEGAAERHIHFL